MTDEALLAAARAALRFARAPLTRFRVGAALLAADGRLFTGCNVESLIPSLSSCAERTALLRAYADGADRFVRLAVAAERGDGTPLPSCYPCGACRQMLHEAAPQLAVVVGVAGGRPLVHPIAELLPWAFGTESVGPLPAGGGSAPGTGPGQGSGG